MGKENKQTFTLNSPGGLMQLEVTIIEGALAYQLRRSTGEIIVAPSKLSLMYGGRDRLEMADPVETSELSYDETWEQPWGEQRSVRNHYNELALKAKDATVRFRLYDEGVGFRYELGGEGEVIIEREETDFAIDPQSHVWWIPALGGNHYEHLYKKSLMSEIGIAHTPLTVELSKGGFAAIHEAALYDYGSMNLVPTERGMRSAITPLREGGVARVQLPFTTPWRTIIFSETAVGLGVSRMMLNLNEPSKIADTSWVKPAKFMGIWWAMFIGYFTWASGEKHGATTGNALRYINAAKKLGISALLIEGWNESWDGDWTKNGEIMNHMQPYPDFDIHVVTSYAKSQGVEIVGHHETSGNISHYEWQLPEAYDYYRHLGVRYVKTGYVSPRFNTGDFHSSQVGVLHYQKTVEMMAERQMMVDIHEPVKGTGIERTWPNLMTREGVMGQEYEGGAVSPEHATVLPFTRLLSGPLDYTPGIFNLNGTSRKVRTTLAKQLAFYVTMFSPLQMVADLPEHYEGKEDAFRFIRDVPVSWETTVPIDGVIGDYFVTARKDRDSDSWFIGGVSDEESRTVSVPLGFLEEYRSYIATIYRDSDDAHFETNPEAYVIETRHVTKADVLTLRMAPGGGFAVSIMLEGETAYPYPATH